MTLAVGTRLGPYDIQSENPVCVLRDRRASVPIVLALRAQLRGVWRPDLPVEEN
jgi:hypothetical protein